VALPISGPTYKLVDLPLEYSRQARYKQKRPYNLQLPYQGRSARARTFSYPTNPTYSLAGAVFVKYDQEQTEIKQAKQLAYAKLIGSISDRASMGENLGQLGSSVRLITDKALVIRKSLLALRKFDLAAFTKWVDKGFVKRNSRFAAQLTLEVNFAIAPAVNDIYSAISILQEPIKNATAHGRATVPFTKELKTSANYTATWSIAAKASAEYGAVFAISNPNLYLANALGLINPVQTAWQLLPGSFLFDWLVPVEQFLGTATDFYGLSVVGSYTTWFVRGVYSEFWNTYRWSGTSDFAEVVRETGISLPPLTYRPLKVPSLKRAANAVSLAIQAFYK